MAAAVVAVSEGNKLVVFPDSESNRQFYLSSVPAPGPVTDLACVNDDTSVNCGWSGVSGATGYDLEDSSNDGTSAANQYTTTATSYVIISRTVTTWRFRIRAKNSGGESAWTAWTAKVSLPAAVTGLACVNESSGVRCRWTGVTGATGYDIEDSSNNGVSAANRYATTSTDYLIGGRTVATWRFRARATNAAGASAWTTWTARVPVPSSVTGFTCVNESTSVRCRWTAVSGATGYDLQDSSDNGVSSANQYALTGVTSLIASRTVSTWRFRVRAKNAGGAGAWSPWTPKVALPGSVSGLDCMNESTGVRCRWTAVATATGYDFEDSSDNGQSAANRYSTTFVSYLVGGRSTATWRFRVRAKNVAGPGSWSAWSAMVTPMPGVTTPFTRASGSDITITIPGVSNVDINGATIDGDGDIYFFEKSSVGIYRRAASGAITKVYAGGDSNSVDLAEVDDTLYLLPFLSAHMERYDVSGASATKGSNFLLSSSYNVGAWSDGTTLWVLRFTGAIQAYTVSTGSVNNDLNCNIGRSTAGLYSSMWSDGETVWVGRSSHQGISAYTYFPDCKRLPAHDIRNNLTQAGTRALFGTETHLYAGRGGSLWAFHLPAGALAAPTGLRADILKPNRVSLVWDAVMGAASYDYQYRKKGATQWSPLFTAPMAQATIMGLEPSTDYEVRIRASNQAGHGDYTDAFGFRTTAATRPAAPSTPTTLVASDETIQVSWAAPDDGGSAITDYDLRYRADGTSSYTAATDINELFFFVMGLTEQTTYHFSVRATNAVGASDWSPEASGTSRRSGPILPTVSIDIEGGPSHPSGSLVAFDLTFTDLPQPDAEEGVYYIATLGSAQCDGAGMGAPISILTVDENPEARKVFSAATCQPGDYTLDVRLVANGSPYEASAALQLFGPDGPFVPAAPLGPSTVEEEEEAWLFAENRFADPNDNYYHGTQLWVIAACIIAVVSAIVTYRAARRHVAPVAGLALFLTLCVGVIAEEGINVALVVVTVGTGASVAALWKWLSRRG